MESVSKDTKQSSSSLLVSFGVHFGLLLLLSVLMLDSRINNTIFLDMEAAVRSDDLVKEIPVAFEFPNEVQAVNFDTADLDSPALELLTEQAVELLDLADFDYEGVLSSTDARGGIPPAFEIAASGGPGFFGIEATGNRVVYVLDMSPSMQVGHYQRRYDRAVAEVLRSIDHLRPDQEFFVYLFCFQKIEMNIGQSNGEFCLPTIANKDLLKNWLTSIRLASGTDPRESLVSALKQDPTCIFLLSDGEFNGERFRSGKYRDKVTTVELAKRHNKSGCPIHTIGLEDEANQADMTKIASQSGGIYKFVPTEIGP